MLEGVDFASLKILVVDDQEFVRKIVMKMLNQLGVADVREAQDGNTGLAAVVEHRPHLVICDIQMRPIDGFGFVRMLRGTPEVASTPVIMLTAHTDAATMARARELSISSFLAKPVLPPALKDKIQSALSEVCV